MPTVLRWNGYRFSFWSNEGREPPHVHVTQAERYAKFWLQPVTLVRNRGFRNSEVTEVHHIIEQHLSELLAAWNEHFSP